MNYDGLWRSRAGVPTNNPTSGGLVTCLFCMIPKLNDILYGYFVNRFVLFTSPSDITWAVVFQSRKLAGLKILTKFPSFDPIPSLTMPCLG
jgi:hypothetical protein